VGRTSLPLCHLETKQKINPRILVNLKNVKKISKIKNKPPNFRKHRKQKKLKFENQGKHTYFGDNNLKNLKKCKKTVTS
jgi:hypothetical protein